MIAAQFVVMAVVVSLRQLQVVVSIAVPAATVFRMKEKIQPTVRQMFRRVCAEIMIVALTKTSRHVALTVRPAAMVSVLVRRRRSLPVL